MKKVIYELTTKGLVLAGTILVAAVSLAQTPKQLPYTSGFENVAEKDGWTEYRLAKTDFFSWSVGTSASHDYPVGASSNDTTYDWLVSPWIAMDGVDEDGRVKIKFSFKGFTISGEKPSRAMADYFGVWLSFGSGDPNQEGEFHELADLTDTAYGNNWQDTTFWVVNTTDTDQLSGHIAFVYRATNNWFTIDIDDIDIRSFTTDVDQPEAVNISVYPNPLGGANNLHLDLGEMSTSQVSQIDLVNVLGQNVQSFTTFPVNSDHSLDVPLDATALNDSFYLLRLTFKNGAQVITKLMR